MAQASSSPSSSLVQSLAETSTWRLLVIILVQLTGSMFLVPVLPSLLTDDFAAARLGNGTAIRCSDYAVDESPEACVEAHGDVVAWSTASGFVQNAVLSIIIAPWLGAWSDRNGRKPVILLSQLLSVAPIAVLIAHVSGMMRLSWIYVVQPFTQSVSIIAPSLAYMADRIDREQRAAAFGLIIASFSVAILIGPPVGAMVPLQTVPYATLFMLAIATAGTVLFLPESRSAFGDNDNGEKRRLDPPAQPTSTPRSPLDPLEGLVGALRILKRSRLFVKLTVGIDLDRRALAHRSSLFARPDAILTRAARFARSLVRQIILVITAATGEALQDILIQYLQLRLGFGPSDTSAMFVVLGAGALLVQGFLLPHLLRLLGESRLLFVGLVVGGAQQLLLVLATRKWQAIGAVALGSLGSVTFPTISGIKANNSSPDEQGAVQGALYGARALASGIGPLIFGMLFRSFLDVQPGVPFVLGAILMAAAACIAWTLDEERDGLDRLQTGDWREGIEAETASLLPHST